MKEILPFRLLNLEPFLPVHFSLAILLLLAPCACLASDLNALLVGGGPDPGSNAAQIESHVRFVGGLLPASTSRRVLFADGKPETACVSVSDDSPAGRGRTALSVLLPNSGLDAANILRQPELDLRVFGPSTRETFRRALAELLPRDRAAAAAPLLLYFAGHGARDDDSGEVTYCFWQKENLTVREFAGEIARVSPKTPLLLVMAQCYSGAFADALFRGGDNRKNNLAPQNFVGFFSARPDRTAAGCGTETGEADYQDFSSYFFGALCGHDRFGKPVAGADADGDGRVSLHEAFCWALGHDASFDTPLCTSDVYLERFTALADEAIFSRPFHEIREMATPAQRAALDALSEKLGAEGEDRALKVYDRLTFQDPIGRPAQLAADRLAADDLSHQRDLALGSLLAKWPALRWGSSGETKSDFQAAAGELKRDEALTRKIIAAARARDDASATLDNEEAWLIRFTGLCRSVVRADELRAHGDAAVKARFERLCEAEGETIPLAGGR